MTKSYFSRFLPNYSYLDATEHTPRELAKAMQDIINHKEKYFDYFRWHKYYSFHDPYKSADTDDYCAFCTLLNDVGKRRERSVYTHFGKWWNVPLDWPRECSDGRHHPTPVTKFKEVQDYKLVKQSKTLIQIPLVLLSHIGRVEKKNKTNFVFSWLKNMYYNFIQ